MLYKVLILALIIEPIVEILFIGAIALRESSAWFVLPIVVLLVNFLRWTFISSIVVLMAERPAWFGVWLCEHIAATAFSLFVAGALAVIAV